MLASLNSPLYFDICMSMKVFRHVGVPPLTIYALMESSFWFNGITGDGPQVMIIMST